MTGKYVVPEGGLKAAVLSARSGRWNANPGNATWVENPEGFISDAITAFIAWQSGNPIVPTRNQAFEILQRFKVESNGCHSFRIADALVEWQRRMYLSPEPEVPKEVKDLLQIEYGIDPKSEHTVLVQERPSWTAPQAME